MEFSQAVEIESPLSAQLDWFLASVNSGGGTVTEAEITAHIAPALLAIAPPAQIIGFIQQLAAGYGTLTSQGLTRIPTVNQAVALLGTTIGIQLALPIALQASAPHLITGLTLYPAPSADGTPLQPVATSETEMAALIDIGGRGLYRAEQGAGGPTVVLEAGLGDSGATWSGIIPAIGSFARVVSYDRANANAGASDPAVMPRTAADAVADLHALLHTAGTPGPFVLVGHSIGGIFARLFASSYPDEVAGLVLIDSAHEEQDERRRDMVPADLFATEQQMINSNEEGIDIAASFDEMRAANPFRPMPLIVISAGQDDPTRYPAEWPMEAEALLHDELQRDLAALVPGGRHIVAKQSGHYIQQSQPDVIVTAIREVVQAVIDSSAWVSSGS